MPSTPPANLLRLIYRHSGPAFLLSRDAECLVPNPKFEDRGWEGFFSDDPSVSRASLLDHDPEQELSLGEWRVQLEHWGSWTSVCLQREGAPAEAFRAWVGSLPEIAYLIDREGLVAWTNTTRHDPRLVESRRFVDLVPPDQRETVSQCVSRVFESGRVYIEEAKRVELDGQIMWFSATWLPILENGRVDYVALLSQNVTAMMNTHHALEESERRYRQLMDNSLDLIMVFSSEFDLLFCTPNLGEILGYTPDELRKGSVWDIVHPDDVLALRNTLESLQIQPRRAVVMEGSILKKDGMYSTFEARARTMEYGGQRVTIINARDVTERHESDTLRQHLIRADKLAAIGQLAAGVAHEINNPAAYIYTNLYVLKEYAEEFRRMHEDFLGFLDHLPPDAAAYYLKYMEDSQLGHSLDEMGRMIDVNLIGMDRISRIVNDLRTFSRDDADEMEFLDFNAAILTASHMVENQIRHHGVLELELDETLPTVWGNRGRISQVVVNLLVNAAHAIGEADAGEPRVTIRSGHTDHHAWFEVSDNGPGIPEEIQGRLFEPFFTTKTAAQGTGLGLWLCASVVTKLGGTLDFDSSAGVGTTFRVRIPLEPEDGPSPSEAVLIDEAPPSRILVVDDDELVLESYGKLLGGKHEIIAAHGGKRAISLLTPDAQFDAIFCDVSMQGVDGPTVHAHLRDVCPHLVERTVFCTAGVFTSRTRQFVNRIANRVVHKPLSPRQIKQILAEIVVLQAETR